MNQQLPPAPPLPTSPRWTSSTRRDESEVHTQLHGREKRAEHAEKRLKNALRELKRRGRNVAADVQAVAPSLRMTAIAVGAGIGAVCFVAAMRWALRVGEPRVLHDGDRRSSRRAKRRSVPAAVGRSLAGELMARVALGAAGVIGARIAADLVAPALSRALTEGPKRSLEARAAPADDEDDDRDRSEADDSEE
jgi:hypothetical protein